MNTLKYTISEDRPLRFETISGGYKLNYDITQLEDGTWQYYTMPLSTTMYNYIKGDNDKIYECVISKIVRQRYPDNDMTAILSNYLAEPENEKYQQEFFELQNWRKLAKTTAKSVVLNEII